MAENIQNPTFWRKILVEWLGLCYNVQPGRFDCVLFRNVFSTFNRTHIYLDEQPEISRSCSDAILFPSAHHCLNKKCNCDTRASRLNIGRDSLISSFPFLVKSIRCLKLVLKMCFFLTKLTINFNSVNPKSVLYPKKLELWQ